MLTAISFITNLLRGIPALFKAVQEVDESVSKGSKRVWAFIGFLIFGLGLFFAIRWARQGIVDGESPFWEVILFFRLFLAKMVASLVAIILGTLALVMIPNWIENTKIGKRVMHHEGGDNPLGIALVVVAVALLVGQILAKLV